MFDISLENEQGSLVNINDTIRYEVIEIEGLNPPSATLYTSKSPNKKGAKYNGSSLDVRNVIIYIKILGDVESNRNHLYSWADSESYCKIRFKSNLKNIYCEGYVTECPVDIFSDNEVMSLAVQCPDPYLKDLQDIVSEISKISKGFTFPFSIEQKEMVAYSTTLPNGEVVSGMFNRGIPFSTIKGSIETTIYNAGAPTGMVINVICKEAVSNLLIYDGKNVSRKIEFKYEFPKGCSIMIDTDASPKIARAVLEDGTKVNLMKHIVGNVTWLTLKKGHNSIGHRSDSDYSAYTLTVSHTNKYLGI